MRALVVDDSMAMCKALTLILNKLEIEALLAQSGRDALACLHEHSEFDLALFDLNMPGMDGMELLRAVRTDSRYDAMKVMMVTTATEMDVIEAALQNGADEYVMKPFTEEIILNKLQLLGLLK